MYYSDILCYLIAIAITIKTRHIGSLIGLIVYLLVWGLSYLPSGGSIVLLVSLNMIDIVIIPINCCSDKKISNKWIMFIQLFMSLIFISPMMYIIITNSLYAQLYLAIVYYGVFTMVIIKIIALYANKPDLDNLYLVNEETPLVYFNTLNNIRDDVTELIDKKRTLSYLFIYSLYSISILLELFSDETQLVRGYLTIVDNYWMNIYGMMFTSLFGAVGASILLVYTKETSNKLFISLLISVIVGGGSILWVVIYNKYMGELLSIAKFTSISYSSITLGFFILHFLNRDKTVDYESDSDNDTIYSIIDSVSHSDYLDAASTPEKQIKHSRKRSSSEPIKRELKFSAEVNFE